MNGVRLRRVMPGDAGRLLAVYAPYVLESAAALEYAVPSRMEMESRIAAQLAQGLPWLVAEGPGGILGYAYAARFAQCRASDWNAELFIYLSADECGRGIGKALYAALMALLFRQGYCTCYALVAQPNEAANAFHLALGFHEQACLRCAAHKLGQWRDLSYYAIALCELPAMPSQPVACDTLDEDLVHRVLRRAAEMIRS